MLVGESGPCGPFWAALRARLLAQGCLFRSAILLVLLVSAPLRAAPPPHFALTLDPHALTAAEVAPLREFLFRAEGRIPAHVKARIGREVRVSFAPLGDAQDVSVPRCPDAGAAMDQGAEAAAPQVLGDSAYTAQPAVPHRIALHAGLKPILLGMRALPYPCGHRSLQQLALATLLHEVIHLYDRRERVSDRSVYQNLHRFARQGLLRRVRTRNELHLRSPDPYEFADAAESLAVNAEYFLLDPSYRCRRPATYSFLEEELHVRPAPDSRCDVNTQVYASGDPVQLDPDRIYQIHVLLASEGEGIGSRFGHLMFRLILCAEDRPVVSAACLEDVQDHVVLSFVANQEGDAQISAWKGLTGGYPSQLFVRRLSDVIIEYTELEFRDLQSLPLRMSAQQKARFVHRVLELYWSYSGRYFFLTNNCTSESLSLLKSALDVPAVQSLARIIPAKLRDDLVARGLIEPGALRDQADRAGAERRGLYFPSLRERYADTYAQLRRALPPGTRAPRSLRGYLRETTAAERRAWAQSVPPVQAAPARAGFFALEGLIANLHYRKLEQKLVRFVYKNMANPRYADIVEKLKGVLAIYQYHLPWRWAQPGYGIPLSPEVRAPDFARADRLKDDLSQAALALLPRLFHAENREYAQVRANRQLFLNETLREMKDAQAMQLRVER